MESNVTAGFLGLAVESPGQLTARALIKLINYLQANSLSARDYLFALSSRIADVITGGDVDAGSLVDEEYLMALERKHFCELLDQPKTQERIMGMLQTGKPVRN